MMVGKLRVRRLVPVAALATIAVVYVPVSGAAQQAGVCDQAIAEAGTGQGTFGDYELIQAPDVGRSGSQVVVGTAGADRLVGGSGNDVLCGLGGDDVLVGGSGHDYLNGGDGSDELRGDSGNDQLDGGGGFDRLFGGSGNDALSNGEVNDGGSGQRPTVPAPAVDISAGMPRVMRDEITGDFLNRGYDQRARAEDTNLNIYDSASHGGALLHSTPMDLTTPPDTVSYACGFQDREVCNANTWSQYSQPSSSSCNGCFAAAWSTFHLNTIYLARNNTNIFIAGVKGNTVRPGGAEYRNLVYVLPGDGSCASESCAQAVISLPTMYNDCDSCSGEVRYISVTSLAVGSAGGPPLLAVGLSDGGVRVYEIFSDGPPLLAGEFHGMATGDNSQTPPTALAWDPSGSGLLAVGLISRGNEGFVVPVQANGMILGGWLTWSQQGGLGLSTGVLSAAFGQRQNGSPVVAFGMSDGTVRLIDPTARGTTDTLAQSTAVHGVIAINPIPRFDGSSGGSDFAVSYQVGAASNGAGAGGLLRWDGTSGNLTALPVSTGSPNTVTADWDSFRKWYPGIKQGRFQVSNSSAEPITVTLHTGSDSASGCWYAPSWADSPAFPAAGITVPGGQTSARYVMGAYTAGPDGTCSATNNTDIWRGYLVITPVNHPADARLVRLRLNPNMSVDVDNQAGGQTTVNVTEAAPPMAAFGLWTVSVSTPAPPAPLTAPTVTGQRVTPTELSGPAVYRFDVTGATFQLGNDGYAIQMAVSPMIVQGSLDGTTWTDVGTLVPATAPTIVPQGTNEHELQIGPATFWWENAAGQPAYQHLRVLLGSAGPPSAVVTLADLPAPAAPTNVNGPVIAAATSDSIARPVDTGIDQAPLSVQVQDTNSQPLPISDPSYERIYYRAADTHVLITNLFGTDPSTFIGVSPYAGAYPNNGSAGGGAPGTFDGFHYLATTSTIDRHIIGYVATNTSNPAVSNPIEVHATAIAPVNNTTAATNGIALAGCQDFATTTCRLAEITTNTTTGAVTPAVYLDTTNGIQVGLLTVAQATTAVSTLPLQHANGTAEHPLGAADLSVSPTTATLTDASAFQPNDRVDTNLVTHGIFVPITDIPVQ